MATFMDVLNQGAGWQPEAVLASNVPERVGAVNSFSFDIGQGPSGAAVLRVAAVVAEGAASHAILTRDCSLDLQGCQDTGWSTAAVQGEDYSPSLRYGAGTWALKYVTNVGTITSVGASVMRQNGTMSFGTLRYSTPCGLYGDYDEIDAYGDGRFFSPYFVGGPGCRWNNGGLNVHDSHIGGSVFAGP